MNTLVSRLDKIEKRLQQVIEGRLARLFPTVEYLDEFTSKLMKAMRSGIQIHDDGTALAPDSYVLSVSQDLLWKFDANNQLLVELAENIKNLGENGGLIFAQHPQVTFSSNADLDSGFVHVIARISLEEVDETEEISNIFDEKSTNLPKDSFLIVNGSRIFPLEQPLINIGRRSDNDLVLEDERISRIHAQLRAIRGKYVLSDLNSKGGTYVNGKRVGQQKLNTNDVISLAGVPLVYSQDRGFLGRTEQMNKQDQLKGNEPSWDNSI